MTGCPRQQGLHPEGSSGLVGVKVQEPGQRGVEPGVDRGAIVSPNITRPPRSEQDISNIEDR